VPTREQVRVLAGAGRDYRAAGRQLGIPAGQAYLIATGLPADGSISGSDAQRRANGGLASSQAVRDWIATRVAADPQMRAAAAHRAAAPHHHAGMASADDPKYTVIPQRERVRARQQPEARS
jgi:hypothetical protein